ncbi:MAG: hypothetical protein JXA44_06170 [Methanospirillaceae archaeon]|nr:hypothetical protein [Methanospirillaceae archaeon]
MIPVVKNTLFPWDYQKKGVIFLIAEKSSILLLNISIIGHQKLLINHLPFLYIDDSYQQNGTLHQSEPAGDGITQASRMYHIGMEKFRYQEQAG